MTGLPCNVGGVDRVLRGLLGVLLLVAAFAGMMTGTLAWVAGVVGAVLLATAAFSFCPAYTLVGLRTCKP